MVNIGLDSTNIYIYVYMKFRTTLVFHTYSTVKKLKPQPIRLER